MNRRLFLRATTEASIGAAVVAVTAGFGAPVAQARQPVQPEAPDAGGGFLRMRGWSVCIPSQEMAQHGDWVLRGVMDVLQPKRWHAWGIWPETDVPGRVPAIFSDQYFDRPATRQYLIDHPGCEWASFNEPEIPTLEKMMPGFSVDAMTPEYMSPELAAEVTLEFVDLGRSVGNDFQFMSPSVTLDTEHDGLEWLTEYVKIMRRKKMYMRPSSWGIHPYNCGDVSRLRQSMAKWWTWWNTWGSGAPTIITEVCAEGSPVAMQKDVMDECKRMLDASEVLGVSWASAYLASADGVPWEHYPLCTLDYATETVRLTELGRHWKGLQAV